MTIRYLLDTNILSEPLRAQPNEAIVAGLQAHAGEMATAVLVWHELLFGAGRLPDSRKKEAITAYLQMVVAPAIPRFPYDEAAAEWHAQERVRLQQLGRTPPFIDGQIAAIAKVNGLTLVTVNIKDYALFDLPVICW